MKITIAQLNPVVGDIEGNVKKIVDTLYLCGKDSTDLVVFPELVVTGYPPRDLLERPWFIQSSQKAIEELIGLSKEYAQIGIILGAPLPTGKNTGRGLYNSALLIHSGKVLLRQPKSLLPTYDVFDEARYFDPGSGNRVVPFKGEKLGISICEDAWNDPQLWLRRQYSYDPIEVLAERGATVLINVSASPFHLGKDQIRYRIISSHAKKHGIPFLFVNQVGGNDELIFDGRSLYVDGAGRLVEDLPAFEEQIRTVDIGKPAKPRRYLPQEKIESLHQALVVGFRDYFR
jgi:NAD+ synthase (glutamine-hydrolysing)